MTNVDNATLFLINTLFGLYIYAVILRVLLQIERADFYNPLAQFIWRITNPPVVPLRRVIPRVRQLDLAGTTVAFLLIALNVFIDLLIIDRSLSVLAVLWFAGIKAIVMLVNLFTFSILIQAIMSWFGANLHSPASSLLWNLNEPLLRPVRRVLPAIGGLDLSPLFVIIALQFVAQLLPLPMVFR